MQVTAPWRSIQALTPDATQLADPTWRPTPFTLQRGGGEGGVSPQWQQAADWAKEGRINNLSLMALDVLMAPSDSKDRSAHPEHLSVVSCVELSSRILCGCLMCQHEVDSCCLHSVLCDECQMLFHNSVACAMLQSCTIFV